MFNDNPRLRYAGANGPGPLTKALAIIAGATVLVVGFMFSIVLVGVALVVGSIAGGVIWWKTRHLRRELRDQMERMRGELNGAMQGPGQAGTAGREGAVQGTIIEGDAYIHERRESSESANRR